MRKVAVDRPAPWASDAATVPAVVVGSGITALGTVRTLSRLGIPVYSVVPSDDLVALSRWHRAVDDGAGTIVGLSEGAAFEHLPFGRVVPFACTDAAARAITRVSHADPERFPCVIPREDTLNLFLDKASFARVLAELELPHPRTRILSDAADLACLENGAWVRPFLKPTDSHGFYRRHKAKACFVRDRAHAETLWRRFHDEGLETILQDYVPGPPTNHWFVDGYRDRHGRIRARFARQRIRMYPVDFGSSSSLISRSLTDAAEPVAVVDRLVEAVDYRGIYSAELKRDERDGRFRLLEVNARPWWYVEYAARCGVDVCELAYRDALGLPLRDVGEYAVGKRLMLPYHDYAAMQLTDLGARPSLAAWALSWLGSQQAILSWSDPVPGIRMISDRALGWVQRHVVR